MIDSGLVNFVDKEYTIEEYEILEFDHPQILHMLIMLTNRCNMNCKYCYTEANKHLDEQELSGKDWIELFEKVKIPSKYLCQNISFTGGEPTIHPDFLDILNNISGKYKIEISSNGLEISDKLIHTLKNLEGLNFFNISIDSYKPYEDEFMRGYGTYEKRFYNLQKLYENNIPLCIGIVVNSITVNSLEDTTEKFIGEFLGVSIKYIPITRMGLASDLDNFIFLSEDDAKKYLDVLLKMKHKYPDYILTDPSSFFKEDKNAHWSGRCSHMKFESEKDLYLTKGGDFVKSEKCNAAYGVVAISPSGRLQPCLRPESFFEEIFDYIPKDIIMPKIVNLTKQEIETLPFWKIVKTESYKFDPTYTCALKSKICGKNEYK